MSIYLDLPSPFGLPALSDAWCAPIAAYDRDLVIFPSQKHPHYRIARKVRHGSVRNWDVYKTLPGVTDDIRIMLERQLVALPFALPPGIGKADPTVVVGTLYRRDGWRFKDDEAVADRVEQQEAAEKKALDDRWKREEWTRRKALRVSYLYRTGARVSLVSPRLSQPAPAASSTQTGPTSSADCST